MLVAWNAVFLDSEFFIVHYHRGLIGWLLIGLIAWIAAGVPGLRQSSGAPSVTIQFAPAHQPAAPVRAYGI